MGAKKKICCISDLHGNLPYSLPMCDILIIAGDICPNLWPRGIYPSDYEARKVQRYYQMGWIVDKFDDWMYEIIGSGCAKYAVLIPGNHDFIFDDLRFVDDFKRRYDKLGVHLLIDELQHVDGLNIYGTPWCKKINGSWAFEAEEYFLEDRYKHISSNTDIIVSHGPAYSLLDVIPQRSNHMPGCGGYDDTQWPEPEHVGSKALLDCVLLIQPKLLVHGHIHEGYGITKYSNTIVVNASLLDEQYNLVNKPIIVEL